MIDVTIERRQGQTDLQIPTNFMMIEMKALVAQIFKDKGQPLTEPWIMQLKDKPINIEDYDYIEDFPVGNGDIFEIIEWESK